MELRLEVSAESWTQVSPPPPSASVAIGLIIFCQVLSLVVFNLCYQTAQ